MKEAVKILDINRELKIQELENELGYYLP